jgi:cytoskeleton protein RodZ
MPSRRSPSSCAVRDEREVALSRVGAELRAARLARGEDLGDVAAYLRIRPSFLAALEAGDAGATPGRPYARGFLRSYAEHLGMDADRLVAPLKSMTEPVARCRPSVPRDTRWPALALLAVPVLLLVAVTIARHYDQAAHDELPAPIAAGPAPLLSAGPAANVVAFDPGAKRADVTGALAAEAAIPAVLESADRETASVPDLAARVGRLVLVARANGWIRLRGADQQTVRSGALATGDRVVLPDQQDIRLSTGNAGDIEILLDGQNIGPLGAPGEVARDLAMDPDVLASRLGRPH